MYDVDMTNAWAGPISNSATFPANPGTGLNKINNTLNV